MSENLREAIMGVLQKSSAKGKKKLYINEVPKQLPDFPKRDVNKMVQDMITDGTLAYWSSGSTTYVMTKEDFEAYRHTAEDHDE